MVGYYVSVALIGYYIGWVVYGVINAPNTSPTFVGIKKQLKEKTDSEWLDTLNEKVWKTVARYQESLKNGEISLDTYFENIEMFYSDYELLQTEKGARSNVKYLKVHLHLLKLKIAVAVSIKELAFRLVSGVPLMVLLLTDYTGLSLLLCFLFMVAFAVWNDGVLQELADSGELAEEGEMDYSISTFSKKLTIISFTLLNQLPYLIILWIHL